MTIVYTDEAVRDLDEILAYIAANFPEAYDGFESRLRAIERRIDQWPRSGRQVAERPGVRVVSLSRYPYKVFCRVQADVAEILHIRHSARRER